MSSNRALLTGLVTGALVAGVSTSAAADSQIHIVGSSTVYPFSSYVAEEFGATTEHRTPVVESTGSGGGLKFFCAGNGMDTPDITNASRPMKPSEYKRCRDNGVTDISEAVIGYDGIVFAQATANPAMNLTREQITLAVAAEVPQNGKLVANPYENWSEINPSLPDREILIYGPPTSSGTRDAFEELVLEAVTEEMPGYGEPYTNIRQDGRYVPSGENDNLIVRKIQQNKDAFGVFGYSFLEENAGIQGASIDGIEPQPQMISSGEYPVSRSLFFYTKNAHFEDVEGMDEYVELFMSELMIGPDGYLKGLGLISLPDAMRAQVRNRVNSRGKLQLSHLR